MIGHFHSSTSTVHCEGWARLDSNSAEKVIVWRVIYIFRIKPWLSRFCRDVACSFPISCSIKLILWRVIFTLAIGSQWLSRFGHVADYCLQTRRSITVIIMVRHIQIAKPWLSPLAMMWLVVCSLHTSCSYIEINIMTSDLANLFMMRLPALLKSPLQI